MVKKNKTKQKYGGKNPFAICVPPETIILGDNKAISDYTIGNGVITKNGMQSVLESFSNYHKGKVLEIKAMNLLPITITKEHPLLVAKSTTKGEHVESLSSPDWVEAGKLEEKKSKIDGHYLTLPILKGQVDSTEISLLKYVKNNKGGALTINPNPVFPLTNDTCWLLGLYVAEGCSVKKDIVMYFNHNEVDLHEKSSKIIESLGYSARIRKARTAMRVEFSSYILGRALLDWCGHKAPNKKIPEFILLHKDLSLLKSFLDGYMAGDGYKNISCVTVSRLLALQVQLAYARLGIRTGISQQHKNPTCIIEGRTVNQRDLYHVRLTNYKTVKGNTTFSKLVDDKYFYFPIRSITEKEYNGLVCNIETSDNTYLVNNAIVHNCHASVGPKKTKKYERCVMHIKHGESTEMNVYQRMFDLLTEGSLGLRRLARRQKLLKKRHYPDKELDNVVAHGRKIRSKEDYRGLDRLRGGMHVPERDRR